MATPLLIDALWKPTPSQNLARPVLLAVAGSLLIALCAHIRVPMWPVPMTMQTFAVLLIGLAYGPRLGLATVVVYLAQGLAGLPVFTAGGGISHLVGPTGGYLVGFMFAAYAVGQLARMGWSKPALGVLVAMLAGSALIYLFGFSWLAMAIGAEKAFWGGIMPFLVGDAVKAALAAALLPVAWKAVNKLS